MARSDSHARPPRDPRPRRGRVRPAPIIATAIVALLGFVAMRAGLASWNRNVTTQRQREKDNHWVESIATGNTSGVKQALAAGEIELGLPIAHLGNMTALTFAITTGQHEIVDVLLEAGADPNHRSQIRSTMNQLFQATPVLAAARYWSPFRFDVIKSLEAHGADLHATDADGRNVLHLNVSNERWTDQEMLRWLVLERGFDVNQPDNLGRTPIMMAARFQDATTVKLLIDLGADASAVDASGRTALHFALSGEMRRTSTLNRDAETTVDHLIAAHPESVRRIGPGDLTPLMIAFRFNATAVPSLIQAGADLSATDADGWTPLMHAVHANPRWSYQLDEYIEMLIGLAADPRHADRTGQTPLDLAASYDPPIALILQGMSLEDWPGRGD